MHNFSTFPAGPKRAFCLLLNFSKFWEKKKKKKKKKVELINANFENSSPQRCFRLKESKI